MLTIAKFCKLHGISVSLYYTLHRAGKGPAVVQLGRRRLIQPQAAAAWREALTEPSKASQAVEQKAA